MLRSGRMAQRKNDNKGAARRPASASGSSTTADGAPSARDVRQDRARRSEIRSACTMACTTARQAREATSAHTAARASPRAKNPTNRPPWSAMVPCKRRAAEQAPASAMIAVTRGRTSRSVVGRFHAFSQSARKRFTSSARSSYPRSGSARNTSAQSSQASAKARENPIRCAGPTSSTSDAVSPKREKNESRAASQASTTARMRPEATSAAECAPTATRAQSAIGTKTNRSRSASRAAPAKKPTPRCWPGAASRARNASAALHGRRRRHVVQRRDERHAPDDVAEERWSEKPAQIAADAHMSRGDQEQLVDGSRDDVRESAECDDVGEQDDDPDARRFRGGHEPHHERDGPSGEDAAQEHRAEWRAHSFLGYLPEDVLQIAIESRGVTERPADGESAGEIRQQHDGPEAHHPAQIPASVIVEHRQYDGERVLGEELLAPEDDHEEAHAVAELGDERAPAGVRQVCAQQAFADEREAHRETGGEAGPHQRHGAPAELIAAFLVDRVPDHAWIRGAALLGLRLLLLPLLLVLDEGVLLLFLGHGSNLRTGRARRKASSGLAQSDPPHLAARAALGNGKSSADHGGLRVAIRVASAAQGGPCWLEEVLQPRLPGPVRADVLEQAQLAVVPKHPAHLRDGGVGPRDRAKDETAHHGVEAAFPERQRLGARADEEGARLALASAKERVEREVDADDLRPRRKEGKVAPGAAPHVERPAPGAAGEPLAPATEPGRLEQGAHRVVDPGNLLEPAHVYSGMLPCFLRGTSTRLPRSMTRARQRRRRVSSGGITSSM